ncbi:MAG: hypothetical protein QG574_1140 [Cyanobacteriota bacterium erpe_2018_sw_21hr_WHONDRS-SW48-000092_B_bin.40]|jgi:hypothetical protein|nr:hypothetical protein [Cyanobacteriota bacterium erpe_2018_sw_21hr_WHONDRS-SW48-000092_B_bin.40]
MADTYLEHTYHYLTPSVLKTSSGSAKLLLATSKQAEIYPYFFEGNLLQPHATAKLLLVLSKLVSTRFYTPTNMLEKAIAEADPVVTSGGGLLRFEGFSACCSTYARIDITPEGYKGEIVENGTTNVDFNAPMRATLAMIRDQDLLALSVGEAEVVLKHGPEQVVEKKVKLPYRWLKGFVEVQAYQAKMEHCLTLGRAETIKFLRSIPSQTSSHSDFWAIPAGKGLRLTQMANSSGVKVGGLERLRLLRDLAPLADQLRIFAPSNGESSEWQLKCGGLNFTLTLTAESSRGFSGEGQVLDSLAFAQSNNVSKVLAALKWQSKLEPERLAAICEIENDKVKQALSILGSRGLVGFDVDRGYFHRELPFDIEKVETVHPRLIAARKLLATDRVTINKSHEDSIEAYVSGTDTRHFVRLASAEEKCTCPWQVKYEGARGSCKHILAVKLMVNQLNSNI